MSRRKITDEQREAIVEARRGGEKLDALAVEYGCSRQTICKICFAAGIKAGEVRSGAHDWPALVKKARPLYKRGASLREVAALCKCSKRGLTNALRAAGVAIRSRGGSHGRANKDHQARQGGVQP